MKQDGTWAAYLTQEAATVKLPYLVIGLFVILLLVAFYFTRLPDIREKDGAAASGTLSLKVLRHRSLKWAVVAQFFYVGAQTCVGSYFIRFSRFVNNVSEKEAAFLWGSVAMVGFMAGRFIGVFLMKYIQPAKLLALYAAINVLLVLTALFTHGNTAVYALAAVPFFMSIMFPTIFALGIQGLGEEAKFGSSFLVMAIIGGAVFPFLMGRVSDATHSIQSAYIVPAVCFAVVLLFAVRNFRVRSAVTAAAH
jgi:FHS family L-fucose permease-like MFS transporter